MTEFRNIKVPKKKDRNFIVPILLVFLSVVVGGVIYFFFFNDDTNPPLKTMQKPRVVLGGEGAL